MRSVFAEGDLISAEVQSVHGDGSIALHTRSAKYGKLGGGQLVVVPPNLVKRQKQHFHVLPAAGVDLVLGINGLLWVAPHVGPLPETEQQREALDAAPPAHVTAAQRGAATRVAAAVRALARLYLTISPATIMDAYSVR